MSNKKFVLEPEKIRPLAIGYGGSIATDRIVVDGRPVGYMCRESPINEQDSGWRFFAGDEDSVYMSSLSQHGVYDVNTITNYDSEIIQFLDSPVGDCFERGVDGILKRLDTDEKG
jgi:hypothetical protein